MFSARNALVFVLYYRATDDVREQKISLQQQKSEKKGCAASGGTMTSLMCISAGRTRGVFASYLEGPVAGGTYALFVALMEDIVFVNQCSQRWMILTGDGEDCQSGED